MKTYPKIILSMICWLAVFSASAQKLPATQQLSLYAPDNKPEGLFTASADKFQAYNKSNHLYYTIANNADNLYMIVHTNDKLIIQKIVRWGLTLTVSNTDKIDPGSPSIGFPVPDGDKNFSIIRVKTKDSSNTKIADICKLIAVKNLTGIDGPTISVYNTDGIKAKGLFNDQLEYTYQLTVPLKYLNLSVKDNPNFKYDIKLNGVVAKATPPGARPAPGAPVSANASENSNMNFLLSPTNFSGECVLAAK